MSHDSVRDTLYSEEILGTAVLAVDLNDAHTYATLGDGKCSSNMVYLISNCWYRKASQLENEPRR